MKTLGIGLLILLVAVFAFWRVRYHDRHAVQPHHPGPPADGASVYTTLRNQLLQGPHPQLAPASSPTGPWAVLMDMGTSRGTATVVAVADGTASIYLSSGGGYIGGGQQNQAVRNADQHMLDLARQFQPLMRRTQDFSLPQDGQIIFYAVTDSGVFTAGASERELSARSDWLANLYSAGQDIITQYRLISPN